MFDYDVLSEEEAMQERYQLLPDGNYPGVIKKVTPKLSASGNNMLEIELDIYDKNGKSHSLRDYWVFTRNMIWKARHGADSAGLLAEFEQKKLEPPMLENKNVIVSIRTQAGNAIPFDKLNGKPEGSKYPNKNVVDDYVVKTHLVTDMKVLPEDNFLNDPIPF